MVANYSIGGSHISPPLSIYIHIPWCIHKCPYCDFNSHEFKGQDIKESELQYTNSLIKQLENTDLVPSRPIHSIFFGGGTPSLFSPDALKRIIYKISDLFGLEKNCEITIEANPGAADKEYFYGYQEAGINRMSLGVQSFNENHLKILERIHDQKEAYNATKLAVQLFKKVNIDLMFGLPNQTISELKDDIEMALKLNTTHLSYYHLTIEPNTYFYKHPPQVPDQDKSAELFDLIIHKLNEAHFGHYETSAYAKKGSQCRHNLNYWNFGDYLGIGAGAHSKISNKNGIHRYACYKNPKQYIDGVNKGLYFNTKKKLTDKDLLLEFMMNTLRINDGFDKALFKQRTGLSIDSINNELSIAQEKGLIEQSHDKIKPTEVGQKFLNELLQIFIRNQDYTA